MLERTVGIVVSVIDKVVQKVDDVIAGDGGARVSLTPEQQAQMNKWLTETRPRLREMGIDVDWGNPHS